MLTKTLPAAKSAHGLQKGLAPATKAALALAVKLKKREPIAIKQILANDLGRADRDLVAAGRASGPAGGAS